MKKISFALWAIFFLLLGAASELRAQIVVFPFEDISQDINGVDLEATKLVIEELKKQGFKVIPLEQTLSFLAQNRLRWTGWVEKLTALKVYRELGAELILLGTVTEKDPQKGLFGVSLRLVRASDYQLLWTKTTALAEEERVSLLGLKKYTYPQIVKEVISQLLEGLPEELKELKAYPPAVEVGDFFLRPRYARGKSLMECAVRLSISGQEPEAVYFLVPPGRKIKALKDESRGLYLGVWKAPEEEGRYPINLWLKWGAPWHREQKLFLSTFVVDNTPPKLVLKVRRGEKIGQVIAFRRYVTIVPVLENTEPIARWQLIISGEQGNEILNIEQPGELPEIFNWRGTDGGGHKVPMGRYHLRLSVWDKAGNASHAGVDLLVVKDPPSVSIEAKKESEQIEIDLKLKDHPVPLSNWYIEIWDEEGNLLGEKEGEGPLVKKLLVPSKEKLYYSLEVRDILGNRFRVRNQPLKPIILRAAKDKKKEESKKWLDDF